MRLPGLAEVGEFTFRYADLDSGLQILDPRNNRDARFRPHAGKQPVANLQRAATAFQLDRSLFLVDLGVRCDADQRPQALDVLLTLLTAFRVLFQLHLQKPFFTARQIECGGNRAGCVELPEERLPNVPLRNQLRILAAIDLETLRRTGNNEWVL